MILILSYINSRRQFAQVNDKTSELIDTKLGVAQGSTSGHVLCSMAKLFAFAEMRKHQKASLKCYTTACCTPFNGNISRFSSQII